MIEEDDLRVVVETNDAARDNRRRMDDEAFTRDLLAGNDSVRFCRPERAGVDLAVDELLAVAQSVEVTRWVRGR